jgi:hypothetical protein
MVFPGLIKTNFTERRLQISAEQRLDNARKGIWPVDTEQWITDNLTHPNWQIRNIAVKLIGEGLLTGFLNVLAQLITDTSQVGFVRRNSAIALTAFDNVGPESVMAFVAGLEDPYWEVRTECANGLAVHGRPDVELTEKLIRKIYRKPLEKIPSYPIFWPQRIYHETNFEVRAAMFRALGTVMAAKTYIHALEVPLEEDIWKVREAALEAFVRASRRLGYSVEYIRETLSRLDLTCTEFIPTYPIRQTLSTLPDVHEDSAGGGPGNRTEHHAV